MEEIYDTKEIRFIDNAWDIWQSCRDDLKKKITVENIKKFRLCKNKGDL